MSTLNPTEIRATWRQGPYSIIVDKDREKQMIFIDINPLKEGYLTIDESIKLLEKL